MKTLTPDIACLWPARTVLGECPVWDADRGVLWWADILSGRLMRLGAAGERDEWPLGRYVASMVPTSDGRLLVGVETGIAWFDPLTGATTVVAQPEADRGGNRYNDAKCDAGGNYWFGSMDWDCASPSGALYRMDRDGRIARLIDGISVTNGPAFSLNGRTLYHANTMAQRVDRFDLRNDGTLGPAKPFVQLAADEGYADGMTIDGEDHLWIAHCGGGCLTRYDPSGERVATLPMPVSGVTSCTFGGASLDRLFVTTAAFPLDDDGLAREPEAGGLFVIDGLGIPGAPTAAYRGAAPPETHTRTEEPRNAG